MAQSSSSAAFVIRLGTSRAAQAAASRLLAAGFEDASGDRYGVAVLDALTPDAIAELRALRAAGRRFVALATDPWTANGFQAWAVLAAGADDVLEVTPTASAAVVERIERWRRVDRTLDELLPVLGGMGESTAFRSAMQRVADAALHSDAPVLLEGETGTGKELAAHLVHLVSEPRRSGEFVVLDCGAIVPSLSGSEFFGHERGAYTGAAAARAGAFELAHEGTLFLDELGELPLGLQPELLRVVQEGTFKRVGASEWRRSDFRVVSATSRDLAVDQQAGEFRSDLYHRLAAVTVRLPPLRERAEDIVPLFRHFFGAATGRNAPEVAPVVEAALRQRPYPGNLRELRQVANRAAANHVGPGPISPGDLAPQDRPVGTPHELSVHQRPQESSGARASTTGVIDEVVSQLLDGGAGLEEIRRLVADTAVNLAIDAAGGNLAAAARRLGVTDRALQLRRAAAKGGPPG